MSAIDDLRSEVARTNTLVAQAIADKGTSVAGADVVAATTQLKSVNDQLAAAFPAPPAA